MQGIMGVAENYHTKVITTSPKMHITGATRVEFDERRALEIAKIGIDNFPNR
jgi:carbon-monoxide dehydrogenase catalytic subunit